MNETNSSSIGFEKQIWDAACVLRGNMDASEYKSVVLGLIFLKYISDRFEAKYRELVEEGDGFEEDKDEYTAENIFFVPENARWEVIASAAHTPEVGAVIDDAMHSIEKENKRLKDILPKNFARPELDKRRLGEVVDSDDRARREQGYPGPHLRVLPCQICGAGGKKCRRILHPLLCGPHTGRGFAALRWPRLRSLLRLGRDVCPVRKVH